MRRFLLAIAASFAATAATAGEPDLNGVWVGRVSEPGGASANYKMSARLTQPPHDAVMGDVIYGGGYVCAGTWEAVAPETPGSFRLAETILVGADRCGAGDVTLTINPNDTVTWDWRAQPGGEILATAILTRSD